MPRFLTDRDVGLVQQLLRDRRQRPLTTQQRPWQPDDDHQAPECYVARPTSWMAAVSHASGTGTGTGWEPGSALCDVYRVTTNNQGGLRLKPMGFDLTVHNVSGESVPQDTWTLVTRDKSGTWWVTHFDRAGGHATVVRKQTTEGRYFSMRRGEVGLGPDEWDWREQVWLYNLTGEDLAVGHTYPVMKWNVDTFQDAQQGATRDCCRDTDSFGTGTGTSTGSWAPIIIDYITTTCCPGIKWQSGLCISFTWLSGPCTYYDGFVSGLTFDPAQDKWLGSLVSMVEGQGGEVGICNTGGCYPTPSPIAFWCDRNNLDVRLSVLNVPFGQTYSFGVGAGCVSPLDLTADFTTVPTLNGVVCDLTTSSIYRLRVYECPAGRPIRAEASCPSNEPPATLYAAFTPTNTACGVTDAPFPLYYIENGFWYGGHDAWAGPSGCAFSVVLQSKPDGTWRIRVCNAGSPLTGNSFQEFTSPTVTCSPFSVTQTGVDITGGIICFGTATLTIIP